MIPFNKPYLTGKELDKIVEAHGLGQLAGDGHFTELCSSWLEKNTGCHRALLTHSCTAALEMSAILLNISPGDEIIMPSYTFVSSANAFVLRGGVPVFVDIRSDTLNIDETLIEEAITPNTKAILPVHYAGIACEMDVIMDIAKRHNLFVIEDAAQGIMSKYQDMPLGSIGDIGCISFHETKNIISGEGGALLINNKNFIERAEILRDKGTDRKKFFRGEVDKYSWQDIGSSFLPGETMAAFLYAQLEDANFITAERIKIWEQYDKNLSILRKDNSLYSMPVIPKNCLGNGHLYYLLMRDAQTRDDFIKHMRDHHIQCIFHYIPLHNSLGGNRYGRISGSLKVTEDLSSRIVRFPLWIGVDIERIINAVKIFKDPF